jgi:hypothetical protein
VSDVLSVLKDRLLDRVPNADGVGCFLCKHILGNLAKNQMLTAGFPEVFADGKPLFPLEGKVLHLMIEGFWNDDLKPFVQAKK